MSPRWSDLAIDRTIAALKNTADEQDLNEALLDLRDARAALVEAREALRLVQQTASNVGHAEMDMSCEPGCITCDFHDITVPALARIEAVLGDGK